MCYNPISTPSIIFMNTQPQIAIIDTNTLTCLGLQSILEGIIPQAIIRIFNSFDELIYDTPDMYAHYFVSSQIYFEHTSFFLERHPKAIVLTKSNNLPQLARIPTLNICQSEKALTKSILHVHHQGHAIRKHPTSTLPDDRNTHELSAREIEVLVLITKGFINKEIADKLNISLTTVITHRKNITEKLGIKSVPGLTIYAVINGYVEAEHI